MSPAPAYNNRISWRVGDDGDVDAYRESIALPKKKKQGFVAKVRSTFTATDGTLRPFRLLKRDVGKLIKRYRSDWTTFSQVIIASAIFVFFTNLLPGITFASDLYASTGQNWGTIEIVFSTGLCNVIFSFFSLQPLTILGVTGPFSVIAENLYTMISDSMGVPFLPFMAWTLIHTCWMLWCLAIFNAHEWTMLYVTDFTCEIFGLLTSIIYFSKAFQEFRRGHTDMPLDAFLYSVIDGVGTFLLALLLSSAEKWAPLFPRHVRSFLRQYATAIAVIFFVGIGYLGDVEALEKGRLSTSSERFAPSSPERSTFFVQFWDLPAGYIAVSMLSGAIVTILFFFDHEISTIMCTAQRFRTRKPSGFALEIMLLGLTTAICGILGIPPANGLLPQAPLHSESLMHTFADDEKEEIMLPVNEQGEKKIIYQPLPRVCEQRWSRFLHAGAILACMSPPLQRVLGYTPTSVLAGLFIFMGYQNLSTNPILKRFFWILTPSSQLPSLSLSHQQQQPQQPQIQVVQPQPEVFQPSPPPPPADCIPPTNTTTNSNPCGRGYWSIHTYTLLQITIAIIAFAISLTSAGPAFPLLVVACVPMRLLVVRRIWSRQTLRIVDRWSCREGSPEDDEDAMRGEAALLAGEGLNTSRVETGYYNASPLLSGENV